MIDFSASLHAFGDGDIAPSGFSFAGCRCGIKQSRPDLGILVSQSPAVTAGVFTLNRVRATCVERNASILPATQVRGIVVNSGNANALTGPEGLSANEAMATSLAHALQISANDVLTASTGPIGVPLSDQLITDAMGNLVASVSSDPRPFAEAIVTTDTHIKTVVLEVPATEGQPSYRLLGIAKGAGMIHPNMATTLAFVCTDAAIGPERLQALLGPSIDRSFNAISVDGDTSTNDMALVFANGESGAHVEGRAEPIFAAALDAVLGHLAELVVRDGEGSTRLLRVRVQGAPSVEVARALARGVCSSSLVKCSVFAGQPEWGRVASAIGQTTAELGLELDLSRMTIDTQGLRVYDPSGSSPIARYSEIRRALQTSEIEWDIHLHQGDAEMLGLGCDLGYDYVRINADESKAVESNRARGFARNLTLAAYSPRLKHQLLCEGLAYVRRFTGLKVMIYLQPALLVADPVPSLARDLELCLDAGLKPLAVVPDSESAKVIEEHMQVTGHFSAAVPPDPVTINNYLDRRHLAVLVRESRTPDLIVDLALKLGMQKLVVMGNDQGLRDNQGIVQRISPDTLLAGLERSRFDASDPDLLVLARHAATRGVPALHIVDARVPHSVVGELFTDEGVGTLITRQA